MPVHLSLPRRLVKDETTMCNVKDSKLRTTQPNPSKLNGASSRPVNYLLNTFFASRQNFHFDLILQTWLCALTVFCNWFHRKLELLNLDLMALTGTHILGGRIPYPFWAGLVVTAMMIFNYLYVILFWMTWVSICYLFNLGTILACHNGHNNDDIIFHTRIDATQYWWNRQYSTPKVGILDGSTLLWGGGLLLIF